MMLFVDLAFLFIAGAIALWLLLVSKNMHLWIGSYAKQSLKMKHKAPMTDVYFCLADHYEPYWGGAKQDLARERVKEWIEEYPKMADRHKDSQGRAPQHSFFYPEEEYDEVILDWLADLCRKGYGDVEVHLHHDADTSEGFREKLVRFKKILHERHGLLKKNAAGEIEYAFIHGNWALDNSRPDGRWCGVNDEINILKETGCYADLTMPSAPDVCQTSTINSIYFATDDPERPKSHDSGIAARAGEWREDALLMIQGPLALNWKSRKMGWMPRIESGEVSADNPSTPMRVKLWAEQSIGVEGAPGHIFIKLHAHGTQENNRTSFFKQGVLDRLYSQLEAEFNVENGYRLHYQTSREMFETIRSLCTGQKTGANA